MGIEITDEAADVLRRSLEFGGVNVAAGGGVRVRSARRLGGGIDIQVELADRPLEGETVIERPGLRVFIDSDVAAAMPDAVLTLEPQHETIVVRPARKA